MKLVPKAEFSIVPRNSSKGWIPELIAAAGPQVTETYKLRFCGLKFFPSHRAENQGSASLRSNFRVRLKTFEHGQSFGPFGGVCVAGSEGRNPQKRPLVLDCGNCRTADGYRVLRLLGNHWHPHRRPGRGAFPRTEPVGSPDAADARGTWPHLLLSHGGRVPEKTAQWPGSNLPSGARQPASSTSLLGLRTDKEAKDVVREEDKMP